MTHHCQPHRQGQGGSTNLHLRVVWGHPKTDEPEGNRQLLVDVHQGPAMVLWERKVTVRMRTERPQEPSNICLQLGEIQGRRLGCSKSETASLRLFHDAAPLTASSDHKM